jgi:putative NIF3 family GTP cyclohydrolase 1 type 2
MTTEDIRQHLLSKASWVSRKETVDTVKSGDPMKPISKVGVGWMATIYDLHAAHDDGCELFITHEPPFNDDHDQVDEPCRALQPGKLKADFLNRTGMVVLRCHDAWDGWPGIGIRDSWAKGLGLAVPVGENREAERERRWHAVYRIPPTRLLDFARQVVERVRPLGQDGVEVLGDPERIISRPAVGVGCGGPDKDMIDLGADLLIVCYDGDTYWRDRERFVELGAAVIMVEHGTSEMWGIESLATYLRETFPELTVRYYSKHPRAWHVS